MLIQKHPKIDTGYVMTENWIYPCMLPAKAIWDTQTQTNIAQIYICFVNDVNTLSWLLKWGRMSVKCTLTMLIGTNQICQLN